MTSQRPTLVVGTSLAPASDDAVRVGARLASSSNGVLHLVHAYPMPAAYLAAPHALGPLYTQLVDTEKARRRKRLKAQLERTGVDADDVAATLLEAGPPHAVVADHAEARDAALVIVGASEQHRALGLGSTADRIVRRARCPVLVVRGDLALPPQRVVAPVDLSALSEPCLRRGLAVLATFGRPWGEVVVLHALHVENHGEDLVEAARYEQLADAALQALLDRVDPEGTRSLLPRMRVDPPRAAILGQIADEEADLVLLATHGHGGFIHRLLGSVAESVTRHAPCSILLVPPEATG